MIVVLFLMRRKPSLWLILLGYGVPLWALSASTPFAVRYSIFIVPFTSIWLPCLYGRLPIRFGWLLIVAIVQGSMMIHFHQRTEYLRYIREQGIPVQVVETVKKKIDLMSEGSLLRDCSETGITKTFLPFSIEGDVPAHRQDVDDVCDGGLWKDQIVVFDLHKKSLPSNVIKKGQKILHVDGYEVWRKGGE